MHINFKIKPMSLTEDLKAKAALSKEKLPEQIQHIMNNGIQVLKDASLVQNALKTGDKIPEITLPNATNKAISIQEILGSNKKVILSFYRGGWCPYCNLELQALQQHVSEFEDLGATLVAISPETPDNSLSTSEKNKLSFEVLSDNDNKIADAFQLTFALPAALKEVYLGLLFTISSRKIIKKELIQKK